MGAITPAPGSIVPALQNGIPAVQARLMFATFFASLTVKVAWNSLKPASSGLCLRQTSIRTSPRCLNLNPHQIVFSISRKHRIALPFSYPISLGKGIEPLAHPHEYALIVLYSRKILQVYLNAGHLAPPWHTEPHALDEFSVTKGFRP